MGSHSVLRFGLFHVLVVLVMCSQNGCSFLNAMNCEPAITTDRFLDGSVGEPYAAGIGTTCGEWSQAIRVLSGTLPPGLELGYVEGKPGISGTPTAAGTYAFTLQMVVRPGVAKQYVEKNLSITILR